MALKIEAVCVALLLLAGLPNGVSGGSGSGPRTPDDNNDMASAADISSGVPVSESVDPADDPLDYYKIDVLAGETLKLVLNISDLSASLNLSVLNSTGYVFERISSGGPSRGTTFLNTLNRTLYLEVRADNCASDYTLTVTVAYPPAIGSGSPASGALSISGADRVDYYQIPASVGQTLKMALNFTNLSANLSLRLMAPNGNVHKTVSSGGRSRGTTFLATSNATFYLEVRVLNDSTDYTLTVTVAYPPAISPGSPMGGALSIGGADRVDYYTISVLSEKTLRMELDFTNLSANPSLRLMSANGTVYTMVTSGGQTRGTTFLATSNVTFYIEVEVLNDSTDYTLAVTVAYPPTLSPGDRVSGSLSMDGADRVDYYRFWLAGNVSGQSEVAVLDLTQSGQGVNLRAAIFDNLVNSGGQIYNESWNISQKAGLRASAAHTGWYFCMVFVTSGASGYSMSYSRSTAPVDGDNDHANATPAPRNGTMYGNVSKARDHYDWFSYRAWAPDVFYVNVTRVNTPDAADAFSVIVFNSTLALMWAASNSTSRNYLNRSTSSYLRDETFFVGISVRTAYRAKPLWAWTDEESYMDYSVRFGSTNQAPRLTKGFDELTMNEDENLRLNMSSHFLDIDGDVLDFMVGGHGHITGSYSNVSGQLELAPAPNWAGKDTITIKASDGVDFSPEVPVSVSVLPVADAPAARSIPDVTMVQNGTDRSLDLGKYFFDNDTVYGDTLTYGVGGNGSIRVSITPQGNVTLTAPINFWGFQNMTFTATDNASLTASSGCMVTVGHVNQAPQVKAAPPGITINEDEGVALDLAPVFWDPDGDPITVAPSGNFQINVTQLNRTLIMRFNPAPDASDFFELIKLTAWDDKGLGGNFVILRATVVPVNDPPRIGSFYPEGDVVINENQSMEFGISASDPESGPLMGYTWLLDGQPVMLGVTSYTYRANFSSAGNHTMEVSVDDGELSTTKVWNITVLNVNHEPNNVAILSPKPGAVVREGIPVLFDAQAQDPDGDALVLTWLDGSRTLGTGRTLSMVLPVGSHAITLEVSDGVAVVTSKVVKFTVKANSAPKMDGLSPTSGQKFAKGDKIHFVAVFSDPESDALSYCWTEGGKVLSTSASFDRSDLGVGKHTIALTVSDGILTTNTTLTVEVVEKAKGGFIPGMGACALGVAALAALAAARGRRRHGPGAVRDTS